MKKVIFFLSIFFLLFAGTQVRAQFNCISHEVYKQQLKTDPLFKKNQAQLELETESYIKNQSENKTTSATYIIPVVFHIIHTGGPGNISATQVMDQVAILNKEFNRQQADTALTPWAFKALATAFNVEFRLATRDPQGNCTNGIKRVFNSLAVCSNGWDDVKALSYWPSTQYLNIWIIESMHYPGNTSCVGGGYSAFPGGPANKDGIVMRGDLISNIGTAATNSSWGNFRGRYLVHELGHWFNLIHIWGDANCGNDLVSDTPPAVMDNSGCATFPHNPNNACGSDANGEMFTNYMDYSNGPCLNMFTAGQVTRMTAAINSQVSGKNNLWSLANLNLTGTNDPYAYPVNCNSVPEILPYGPIVVCLGDSVKFTDYSYGGISTSRLWNFSGQSATSLTDSIVKVKYNTAGTYSLSLTKNYLANSATTTYINKVFVVGNTVNSNYALPFVDSLESLNAFDSDWTVLNNNNDARTWQHLNTTSYSGNGCAGIMNFNGQAPSTDELISPPYDLTGMVTATLNFRLHYVNRINGNTDRLKVFLSPDCGGQWIVVYQKAGNSLRTSLTLQPASYLPAVGSSEWVNQTVILQNNWGTAPVRLKFAFTSGGGNNIFIDDINLQGERSVGIKKEAESFGIILFPNPSESEINIEFSSRGKQPVEFGIFDVLGKLCSSQKVNRLSEGNNIVSMSTADLTEGVYFIEMKRGDKVIYNKKFIKQNSR